MPTSFGFGGLSTTATGFITAIPYVFVAIGLYVVPKLADRSGTRYPWIAGTAALGALGLAASALTGNHVLQMAFISLAAMCIFAGQPVLWSLPTRFLTGIQAASGIAVINAVGNLGGGFGPMGRCAAPSCPVLRVVVSRSHWHQLPVHPAVVETITVRGCAAGLERFSGGPVRRRARQGAGAARGPRPPCRRGTCRTGHPADDDPVAGLEGDERPDLDEPGRQLLA
ncbi:hypothetical protein ACFRAO_04770 [Streptomyces sp. NPDC056656]|uniref:hypothetical protein n=1 Tax=Streptomyces sp. NPDC056656 TaxID=3345895 RepID=UPI00368ADA7F